MPVMPATLPPVSTYVGWGHDRGIKLYNSNIVSIFPSYQTHQGILFPSRKYPPVGPSAGSIAAQTMPAAPSETGRPPVPPISH
jgi:hypothetical protein